MAGHLNRMLKSMRIWGWGQGNVIKRLQWLKEKKLMVCAESLVSDWKCLGNNILLKKYCRAPTHETNPLNRGGGGG